MNNLRVEYTVAVRLSQDGCRIREHFRAVGRVIERARSAWDHVEILHGVLNVGPDRDTHDEARRDLRELGR